MDFVLFIFKNPMKGVCRKPRDRERETVADKKLQTVHSAMQHAYITNPLSL